VQIKLIEMSTEFIPPLFKRFGKGLQDLIKEQFEYKKYVKVKTSTDNGVTLETKGEAQKGGDYAGNVKTTFKQADIGTFELELDTAGKTNYNAKFDKLTKGLTVKASGDEKPNGKLEVDFSQEFYSTSLGVDVAKDTMAVDGAGVVGFDGLSVGGAVKYDITGQQLSDYNAGVEYTQPDFTATVKTTNQADRVQASYLHKVNVDLSLGGLFSYDIVSGKRVATFATQYRVDSWNTTKLKADSDGIVAAVLEHRIPKAYAKLLVSGEYNLRNATSGPDKFGFGVTFGDD